MRCVSICPLAFFTGQTLQFEAVSLPDASPTSWCWPLVPASGPPSFRSFCASSPPRGWDRAGLLQRGGGFLPGRRPHHSCPACPWGNLQPVTVQWKYVRYIRKTTSLINWLHGLFRTVIFWISNPVVQFGDDSVSIMKAGSEPIETTHLQGVNTRERKSCEHKRHTDVSSMQQPDWWLRLVHV